MITLGIIGVVAAITLPSVIEKHKRVVLETQFNKAVSQLQQAVLLWQQEEGEDLFHIYYDPWDRNGTALRQAFYKYFKGSYNKPRPKSELKQYYTSAKGSTTTIHYCPVSSCGHPYNIGYHTSDGIMYAVSTRDGQFNFTIDINGYEKGPNKWGIDLFDFDYNEKNVLYNVSPCPSNSCSAYRHYKTTHVNDGIGCTSCAMRDKYYFKKIDL